MRRILPLAFLFMANLAASAQTEKPKPAYDFTLRREEKIKLAEGAAPPEISGKAAAYVLEHSGYVKVCEGANGFTCFDAEGSVTTFPTRLFAEQECANGKGEDEIAAAIAAGYKRHRFKATGKPGTVYVPSDSIFLFSGDYLVHAGPHLMFYAPQATDKDLGSCPRAPNMPFVFRAGQPDAYIIVIPSGPAEHSAHPIAAVDVNRRESWLDFRLVFA
jgi:hypothetical protein